MRMRKSEMRMRQSDKKTLAFEYEFSLSKKWFHIIICIILYILHDINFKLPKNNKWKLLVSTIFGLYSLYSVLLCYLMYFEPKWTILLTKKTISSCFHRVTFVLHIQQYVLRPASKVRAVVQIDVNVLLVIREAAVKPVSYVDYFPFHKYMYVSYT